MKRLCVLLLLLALPFSSAAAELILPEGLTVIEREAFRGDTSIGRAVLSDRVTAIQPLAFADTALQSIAIPPSVTSIAPDAFQDVKTPLLILSTAGSYAARYALERGIDFRADTAFRALIVAQTDYPGEYMLEGPAMDIPKMRQALDGYQVTLKTNLNAAEFQTAVAEAFAGAKEEDVSLVYFSGHGNPDGGLRGVDMTSAVSGSDLRLWLDAVPGRKIVLVDACYSGGLIGKNAAKSAQADPARAFIDSFLSGLVSRSGNLAEPRYFVMASSKQSEQSYENDSGGLFTDAFLKSKTAADGNGDLVVTFEEAYQYVKAQVSRFSAGLQTVQAYPDACTWFGLFR